MEVVDLLDQHRRDGRRLEPIEFVERGSRIAVRMRVTDVRWQGESADVFKVFSFREPGGEAVLLQDCVDRDDALAYLDAA